MSNHMPEVAKMLGVEIGEIFYLWETAYNREIKYRIEMDGLWMLCPAENCEWKNSEEFLGFILAKASDRIHKFPRYTIPEDLEVDTKVWVRDNECDEWEPRFFLMLDKNVVDNECYICWRSGADSRFWANKASCSDSWSFCITDDDYQRRKKEGTL